MANLRTFDVNYDGEELAPISYSTGRPEPCQGEYCKADDALAIIAELEAELKASRWTPISESNLPTDDDEVLHFTGIVHAVAEPWPWEPDGGRDLEAYLQNGYMHRRKINAPATGKEHA